MKIAIVIPTFNRPAYLERCLASLKRSNLMGAEILIVDDASTDKRTLELIQPYKTIMFGKNRGVCSALLIGISNAFLAGADVVINLDSDAIVRNDWLEVLMELHERFNSKLMPVFNQRFYDKIITGFHSTTKNKDGSDRHRIIEKGEGWALKQSVGGINMLFTKETFDKYAKPALEKCIVHGGNWDHMTSVAAGSIICAVPSVVQHIGIDSSLGHTHDVPDVADDFKALHLPNVTLVCVDDRPERTHLAKDETMKNIIFGKLAFLNRYIGTKEAYSKYIINDLHKHIDTDYALIIQHDGYVKNVEAWQPEFLDYDYIGAPWWYKDGMNVGNGGFSLRSKKLLELTAKMNFKETHPEDHVICRTYRKQLEAQGIKFAPVELAAKFSFEGYYQPGVWSGQFGFHGARAFRKPPDINKTGFIINQFFGLGDILFLVPLIRKWMSQGHDIIWPIADQYFGIKENFPDIQFVPLSKFPFSKDVRHEYWHRFQYGRYIVKPLRWNMCTDLRDCMTTKYTMYHEDWQMWRELTWQRNTKKERKLAELVGFQPDIKYELKFMRYGSIPDGPCEREVGNSGLPFIKVKPVDGYTLLDWSWLIENATAIHAVSSACIYLFEMLDLKCEPHLYARKQGMKDFTFVEKLLTKKYHYHI